MDAPPTFENTYAKYEFSELVRLEIILGAWISRMRGRAAAVPPGRAAHPDDREAAPL